MHFANATYLVEDVFTMAFDLDQKSRALLKARDPVFLTELFGDVNPYLMRVLAGKGFYGNDAQDLVQQAWLAFFENIDRFEGRSQLRTFICGILINKLRESRRSSARVNLEEDPDAILSKAFSPDGWWNHDVGDPHRLAQSNQMLQFIEECLEGLSDQQRSAFVLKEAEQEESEDICRLLGVSLSNLRVLIFRAKEKLQLCLDGKVGVKA